MKNEAYKLLLNDKNIKLTPEEILSFLLLRYKNDFSEFCFYGGEKDTLSLKTTNGCVSINDFLKNKNDLLIEQFKKINWKSLHKRWISEERLNLSMHDGLYIHTLKEKHLPKLLNKNIFSLILISQYYTNELLKTKNKFLDLNLILVHSIKKSSYEEIKKEKGFHQFKNKFNQQLNFYDNRTLIENFNFNNLSAGINPDWHEFILETFKNENQDQFIPLLLSFARKDLTAFNMYLKNNDRYYFHKDTYFLNQELENKNISLSHFLAYSGEMDYLKSLLKKEPDLVNSLDKNNESPLFYAIKKEHFSLLPLLVKCGANLSLENDDKHIASEYIKEGTEGEKWFNFLEKERCKKETIKSKMTRI